MNFKTIFKVGMLLVAGSVYANTGSKLIFKDFPERTSIIDDRVPEAFVLNPKLGASTKSFTKYKPGDSTHKVHSKDISVFAFRNPYTLGYLCAVHIRNKKKFDITHFNYKRHYCTYTDGNCMAKVHKGNTSLFFNGVGPGRHGNC